MLKTVTNSTFSDSFLCSFHSNDIEEHVNNFNGWEADYDQISSGAFEGSLTELSLEGMLLQREKVNQEVIKNGVTDADFVSFSVPLMEQHEAFYCDGHAFEFNHLLVSSGCFPELKTPKNTDVVVINVPTNMFQQILQEQKIAFDFSEQAYCHRLTPCHNTRELVGLLGTVMAPNGSLDFLSHEPVRLGVRDAIFQHLLEIVDKEEPHVIDPTARKRVVDRARDYVLSRMDEPPTIFELCNLIGASRRKLQYCFQETLGINPVTYLRILRLNAVHRELLLSPDVTSVQDAAAKNGFLHLSRFAGDYRQLFGELPSDTLKKRYV
ncbi:transcriptional regulator EutR [Marinomonas spartinae]|uniref:helix-turn-helix domain-containing protein n=1 Tax=Marinomonas spartinae TaxID=1792290 RepID=UPI000808B8DA|nr:helix-turn-helix domain-containing protein [Marinomonas spartinae]SBS28958.1 transcriptional regulator EutR [Marinomonas spartinae]